ncbi:MAG: hypothetical protein ACPGUD_01390 [Parashewanella sp.]
MAAATPSTYTHVYFQTPENFDPATLETNRILLQHGSNEALKLHFKYAITPLSKHHIALWLTSGSEKPDEFSIGKFCITFTDSEYQSERIQPIEFKSDGQKKAFTYFFEQTQMRITAYASGHLGVLAAIKKGTVRSLPNIDHQAWSMNQVSDICAEHAATAGTFVCMDLDHVIVKISPNQQDHFSDPEFVFIEAEFPQLILQLKSALPEAKFLLVTHTGDKYYQRKMEKLAKIGFEQSWFDACICATNKGTPQRKVNVVEQWAQKHSFPIDFVIAIDDDHKILAEFKNKYPSHKSCTIQFMPAIPARIQELQKLGKLNDESQLFQYDTHSAEQLKLYHQAVLLTKHSPKP